MKKLYLALIAFLLASAPAKAIDVKDLSTGLKYHSDKVSHLCGIIDLNSFERFISDWRRTSTIPGPRMVFIKSEGGIVQVGAVIVNLIKEAQAEGTEVICVVDGYASSMAFNTLSFCNIRLATPGAHFVVHKVRVGELEYQTAKMLRQEADEIDRLDEPYRQQNAKVMGLKLTDYDLFADQETNWRVPALLKSGYLQGDVSFTGDSCK
jgi:hypothetical protein